ncbi:GNAT family N-acetyltransferase [Streptomyces cinnamoneus]|uniref:GNAT family N-acetyltransferase n=1 Tax=Streptomyces cinnamoneus TaxID=53446 RepID=UPI00344624FA
MSTEWNDPGSAPPYDPLTDPLAVLPGEAPGPERVTERGPERVSERVSERGPERDDCVDTIDLRLTEELIEFLACEPPAPAQPGPAFGSDLLDGLADWGPVATDVGPFQLVPVRIERDLRLITRWMNDPAVAAFWGLSGPDTATAGHLRAQLDGDGRSVPCLGVLGGVPMSYWEVYRADLDPLARHYPARPHDTGIHFLVGRVADRGRGLGTLLLRTVADLVLDRRPACCRVVGEPDLRNTPSAAAFLGAGFRLTAEIELPDKRAALMVRDRVLRGVL